MAESEQQSDARVVELFGDLRGDHNAAFEGPGPDAAQGLARRRRRNRALLTAAAAAAALLVGVGLVIRAGEAPDRLEPIPPAVTQSQSAPEPTPQPSASPSGTVAVPRLSGSPATPGGSAAPTGAAKAATALGLVDWKNSIINLPPNEPCPAKRVQFRDGKADVADGTPWGGQEYDIAKYDRQVVYGDLNGDGLGDAAVVIGCWAGPERHGPVESSYLVAAYVGNAKGGPQVLGAIASVPALAVVSLALSDGVVSVTNSLHSENPSVARYQWNGTRFTKLG
jgi:hypothetical protein